MSIHTLRVYGLDHDVAGQDWDEAGVAFDTAPGLMFDGNSATRGRIADELLLLGEFNTGVAEGETVSFSNPDLSVFLNLLGFRDEGPENLVTLLIERQNVSSGQSLFASKEATELATGLEAAAGTYAPRLVLDAIVASASVPTLGGDFNADGAVDAADYTVWRDGLGSAFALEQFGEWRANFGATHVGGGMSTGVAVPEPTTTVITITILATLAGIRPREQRSSMARLDTGAYRANSLFLSFLSLCLVLAAPAVALAQIKAFPQAEGFGATATGGRGGDVYHVTNLTDSGPGSLRFGIENAPSAGRTIVFDVGGWINLTSKLGVTRSRITIAGQTAPGGIGVRGSQFSVGASDVIVRHMRFRPGKGAGSNNDSINTNENAQRVIYDHISAEFSTDGGFDLQADEVTLQYSSVSYGLISHSTGALIQSPGGGAAGKLSFHHNLWAHNQTRNPKARAEIIDWLDSVVYNYHNGFIAGDSETNVNPNWQANFDGNTYISNIGSQPGGSGGRPMMTGGRTQNYDLYYGVNALDRDGDTNDDPITYTRAEAMASQSIVSSAYNWYDEPFEAPPIWRSADLRAAYERVLAEFGATPWARDEVNTRLAADVVNRTGSRIERESDLVGISNGGFGTLGGVAAPLDSDGDGIPDWWETKHGTDPFTPSNNDDFDQDGYTDLEDYLNDIAAFKAPGPLDFTGVGRYADSKRWTLRWKPSRLDEVHVNAAAAFIDAVGQKAGTLRIGTELGSPGKLYVTSGWLEVTDDLEIGGDGTGIVDQYGGEVRVLNGAVDIDHGSYVLRDGELQTPGLTKSVNGTFSFLGGTLRAGVVGFDLVNDGGAISPGFSIGQTSILGDLTINSGSLQIELASAELADLLVVEGDVTLGGSLDVQLLDDFVPQAGQSWQILTANSILGTFDSITPGFSIELSDGSLWLSAGAGVGEASGAAVPEPAGWILFAAAAIGCALRRPSRQRRRCSVVAQPWQPRCLSLLACGLIATLSWGTQAEAVTLKVIADAELRENPDGNGVVQSTGNNGTSINARFNNNDRNEWIALKFDLSDYDDKSLIENVALRTYMFRSDENNNTRVLRLYALTPGTAGEDWDEATITYGSMPGFTFDANSTTNLLDVGGALTSLGTFSVSGVPNEGNLAAINPTSLTTLVQGMETNDLLTLLISFDGSSNGQWRIASREATQTNTGVLTGAAGDFAPFLQFDVTTFEVGAVQGDYNNDGIIDAADYTVWRDLYGGTGLPNEEVSPGAVDIADFLYWRERFGATTNDIGSAAALAIPEPTGIGLCCLAAVVAVLVRPFSRSSQSCNYYERDEKWAELC